MPSRTVFVDQRYTSMIFFYFIAKTETLWSQGSVTWDFWKSYSIWPRSSTFIHFRVCSGCDEIISSYAHFAQPAFKSFAHMLRVRWNCFLVCSAWMYIIVHVKIVNILPLTEQARKFVWCIGSVYDKVVSAYAQHVHAVIFKNYLKILN